MRAVFRNGLVPLLALVAAFAATLAFGQAREERIYSSTGITVFADRNFRGDAATYRSDVPDLRVTGLNNQITSVRVAAGEEWELCEQPEYRGRCVVVSGEEADLSRYGWSDTISSMRRARAGGPGPEPPRHRDRSIVLFDKTDYRGSSSRYVESTSSLGRFNRRAQSVSVAHGVWELCAGPSFAGHCVTLDHSLPDLAVYNLRGRVSSVRPARDTEPRTDWRPPQSDWSIVLFDRANYRGTPVTFNRDEPSLGSFGGRATSVTIDRGSWELCEGPRFSGRCVTVADNVPDLEVYGLRNRVGSLRPTQYSGGGFGRPGGEGWSIVLFDEPGYRGRPLNYDGPAPDLGAFSERVASVTIGRGVWELCDEPGYSGRCVTLNESVPDLNLFGMRRGVASVRPVRRGPR